MKIGIRIFLLLSLITSIVKAQILGNYGPLTMGVGRDTSINSFSPPSSVSRISVFASGNFSGVLMADPLTGKVTITNAKPVGTYTISVKGFSSSGTSTIKTFTLIINNTECNDGRFNGNTNYPIIRPNLTNLAIGDFNGDNKQDLLAAHIGYNSVSIRLGNGTGGFTGTTEEGVSSHPYSLAVGDFNRDGKLDFIVSNEGADLIAVRLGDGTGAFSSMPNVSVGNSPAVVAAADFNDDGKLDFATANLHSNTVSIRLGDGSGNFTGNTNIPVGQYPECVSIADFNNDGKQDFVVSNSGAQSISVRLGNGNGTFTNRPDVSVGYNPYYIAVGDYNTDGNLDFAVANNASNTVSVRLGDGSGNFIGTTELSIGGGPYCVVTGNFNGDQHLDLAITNYFTNKVSIRYGDGQGAFYGNTQVAVGSYPVCVVAGDFNADKKQDIAVANYNDHNISVRLGMNGLPSPSPIASNSPVCIGNTIQFYASGGSAYSWTGPNGFNSFLQNPEIPVASASDMGIYSLSLMDQNNCSATLSTLVRVNPLPLVTFTLPQDSLCTFDPDIFLSGGQPAGGTFHGPGVVGGNIFSPALTGEGSYYLNYVYTDTNDCSNTATDKMNVILCNDIAYISSLNKIGLFPNPAKEIFEIDLRSVTGFAELELYTLDGSMKMQWHVPGQMINSLSTFGMARGLYFLRCEAENQVKIFKLVLVD